MHRNRLQSIVIDCDDLDVGARFWTAALGAEQVRLDDTYVALSTSSGGLRIFLQAVPEPKGCKSRTRHDIETDNVAAEAPRREALGASRREQVEDWWVMLDPCGNEFCVVPASTNEFESGARLWE